MAYGQAISGNIVGTVMDSSGAAVVNADVGKPRSRPAYRQAARPTAPANIASTTSWPVPKGYGEVKRLPDHDGSVAVMLNRTGTANVTLSPGASTETVEVSGEAPIIDTTTAQLQTTYEEQACWTCRPPAWEFPPTARIWA